MACGGCSDIPWMTYTARVGVIEDVSMQCSMFSGMSEMGRPSRQKFRGEIVSRGLGFPMEACMPDNL